MRLFRALKIVATLLCFLDKLHFQATLTQLMHLALANALKNLDRTIVLIVDILTV